MFKVGINYQKGKRDYMEDRVLLFGNKDIHISAVFDGHGGSKTSTFLKNNFIKLFRDTLVKTKTPKIKFILLMTMDKLSNILLKNKIADGSTANIMVIYKNNYHIANTGDSRMFVAYKNGSVKQITKDHKICAYEKRQIKSRGGFIQNGRVDGILALARAFGDYGISKHITHKPDYYTGSIKDIDFFIQGSDGLFDCATNYELYKKAKPLMKKGVDLNSVGKELVTYTIKNKKSMDNVSIIITKP